ncbi:MAG TPA: hypothetical protein VGM56_25815 [Byssovorax sp.]|jgi:tetratricopeptide (TPR) repeat protein
MRALGGLWVLASTLLVAVGCDGGEAATQAASTGQVAAAPAEAGPTVFSEVPVTSSNAGARAAFDKARDLQLNTREAEAIVELKKAVEAEPGFAFAHAWLGYLVPGPEGDIELAKAMAARAPLPEPERLTIEELAALRGGDRGKARDLARKVVDLAPFDWRAQLDLANRLYDERKFDDAALHYGKAAAFGPNTAPVYNALGYGYLAQHKVDAAVAAFRKYAELKPDEPNALDSLGEALMNGGKLPEAEKAFTDAASRGFTFAWDGVAQTRFLRGDYAGGFEANARSHDEAPRPNDKIDVDIIGAWAALAKGDVDDANKRADAIEKAAQAAKYDEAYAVSSTLRGVALAEAGKEGEAQRELAKAIERGEKAKLPGIAMNRVRRTALTLAAIFGSRAGATADVEKAAAGLAADAKASPTDLDLASLAALGRGATTLSKGDAKAAMVELAACVDQDYFCRWELLLAEQKAGDETSASVSRDKLVAMDVRDAPYLYARAKASAPAAAASPAASVSPSAAPAASR